MVQLRLTLLAALCSPMLAFAAPPELPPATAQQPLVPPGTSAPAMAPLPIEPPSPATTPLVPSDPAGPVHSRSGAESSVAAPAGTLAPRSFRSLDSDADGSLTREEAGADPILRENFADFDSNGDGRLSRDEFASYQPGPGDATGD
ncbi:EF-hand domain-containing protein [Xanthomonas vesicatoria]|uniref:EF-hand domain-containing protein n=1 Tax=Xanthomonas vesicatoria ATCC 35937 TaxID=925775 RepID=F0B7G8_9XANT|nr:EF-hand domain-containing protein [Xanthomonas vesicatoria]EGD11504.1 hypothetical protein XVE_0011 [Xanthomonas vesicatoria ATCC 35937]KTF36067.1 hypothetical protein LMG920_00460 [Xanthomonas vesicatoria]MCC8599174.1 EF-hand domain-containing protein [Xanthomonas vesicatoria]MCC8603836.1 EF-hand domain-containing protein [Xanthomonas vesicatoria]MCC8617867.1 EF-hand domain-containing protein [Xanthomonas vesicatoria]